MDDDRTENTLHGHPNFLQPKHSQIERIRIEKSGRAFDSDEGRPETVEEVCEALSNLPPVFTKNPYYCLGLAKNYRGTIEAVEKLSDCTVLHITRKGKTRIDTDNCNCIRAYCEINEMRARQ